ncbi:MULTISPECIES: NifU family protein [Intestinimonas]|uniref:NifU family protein n=1 Tax=Intestinimonas TaxID=1392389 RepID=UPI00067EB00B|nr:MULTISPECIES: NifU family protein [Intestinimonas]MBS6282624.1 NifU family protein [Oscillospiraceae bacterium]MCI5563614.1 NifU family protein [Intestinimonas massiliensis (ex Afouda et al. 2020)]MDY5340503.1 NifU family protein [Intestinimonas sp.]
MREAIEQALDEYARPILREHCGEVEVTRIQGDTVYVRLLGQCAGCAAADYTADEVLERVLRQHVPGVEHVELDTLDLDLYQYARQLLRWESPG